MCEGYKTYKVSKVYKVLPPPAPKPPIQLQLALSLDLSYIYILRATPSAAGPHSRKEGCVVVAMLRWLSCLAEFTCWLF